MNKEQYQNEKAITGDSSEDTQLLRGMAVSARQYLLSFRWCPPVEQLRLAYGIGDVVAVFYVDFPRPIESGDTSLWVVVGDLPSAYLVTDEIDSPRVALESYCSLMDDWISAALGATHLDSAFPVAIAPTRENVESLKTRIEYLRKIIIPNVP